MQKGTIQLVVGIIIAVLVISGGAYYLGTKEAAAPVEDPDELELATTTRKSISKTTPQPEVINPTEDPLVAWKTIASRRFISISYPGTFAMEEDLVDEQWRFYPILKEAVKMQAEILMVYSRIIKGDLQAEIKRQFLEYPNSNELLSQKAITINGREWTKTEMKSSSTGIVSEIYFTPFRKSEMLVVSFPRNTNYSSVYKQMLGSISGI